MDHPNGAGQAQEQVADSFPELTPKQIADLGPDGVADLARRRTEALADNVDQIMADRLGITVDVYRQAVDAINNMRLQPRIRRTLGTGIGKQGPNNAFKRLKAHWGRMRDYLRHLVPSGTTPDILAPKKFEDLVQDIPADELTKAQAAVRGLEDLNAQSLPDADALYPSSVSGAAYVTDTGKYVDVRQVSAGEIAPDKINGLADGLAQRLGESLSTPSGSPADLHLVVDLSDLTVNKAQLAENLEAALRERLGDDADEVLQRVVFLRTRT